MKEDKSFYTLITGAFISAILAASCCLAPLLFLIFGVSVSSLSFLQIFAPYQAYFSIASAGMILYLWYDYFKLQKKSTTCSGTLCKNYQLYLVLGTLFVLVLLTYPYWVNYLWE